MDSSIIIQLNRNVAKTQNKSRFTFFKMDIFGFSRNVQKLQTSTKSCKRGVKNNAKIKIQRRQHIMVTKLQIANCKK